MKKTMRDLEQRVVALNTIPERAATHLVRHGWGESDAWRVGAHDSGISIREAFIRGNSGFGGEYESRPVVKAGGQIWAQIAYNNGWFESARAAGRAAQPNSAEVVGEIVGRWQLSVADVVSAFGPTAEEQLSLISQLTGPDELLDIPEATNISEAVAFLLCQVEHFPWISALFEKVWRERNVLNLLVPDSPEQTWPVPAGLEIGVAGIEYALANREALLVMEYDALMFATRWMGDEIGSHLAYSEERTLLDLLLYSEPDELTIELNHEPATAWMESFLEERPNDDEDFVARFARTERTKWLSAAKWSESQPKSEPVYLPAGMTWTQYFLQKIEADEAEMTAEELPQSTFEGKYDEESPRPD